MQFSLREQIAGESRRLVKIGALAATGLLLIGIASLFFDDPAHVFFRMLSLLGTGLLIASAALMVITFRKAKKVVPGALLVSLATTLLALLVSTAFMPQTPAFATGGAAFLAGMLVGGGWSMTTLYFIDGDIVRSRGTAWYLVVWVVILTINQLLGAFARTVPSFAIFALIVATGIAVGSITGQLLRYRKATQLMTQAPKPAASGETP